MADDLAPSGVSDGSGLGAQIRAHKGTAIVGGVGIVALAGFLIYRHEKDKSTTTTAASATPASSSSGSSSGSGADAYTALNPYLAGDISSGVSTAFTGSSAGAFAKQIATDTASAIAANGAGPGSQGPGSGLGASGSSSGTSTPGSATAKPSSSPLVSGAVAAGGNPASQASNAGLSVIDKAEALRLVAKGYEYWRWDGTKFVASKSTSPPAGTLFGNTKSLTTAGIPHAGA